MDDLLIPTLSALAGTLVSAVIAKGFIGRSLMDLEAALKMCHEIKEQLAAIEVKIDGFNPIHKLVQEHEKKLYAMRSKNGRSSSRNTNGRNSCD